MMRLRLLMTVTRLAHSHPRLVLAAMAGAVITGIGLAVVVPSRMVGRPAPSRSIEQGLP